MTDDEIIDSVFDNGSRWDKFLNSVVGYITTGGAYVKSLQEVIAQILLRHFEIIIKGDWTTGVVYNVNDAVRFGGYYYKAAVQHTSGVFADDLTAKRWTVYQGITDVELTAKFLERDKLRGESSYSVEQMLDLTPQPFIRPSPAFIKAIMSGTVKVAIVGDSISAGADLWYSNSYAQNFTQMLKQKFPWIKWNVVNYAIGGRAAGNLASATYTPEEGAYSFPVNTGSGNISSQYWPTGSVPGKAWRDHVKDEAPDLIVYAFGMNDGTDLNFFAASVNSFLAYANTWTKKPWFILNSCYLPTEQVIGGNPFWRDVQKGQQELADFVRHAAIANGFGLIDVNATYRMLREGVRREYAAFKHELNFRYWGDATKWKSLYGVPTFTDGVLSYGSAGLMCRLIEARDIDESYDFRIDSPEGVARLNYRSRTGEPDNSSYAVQVSPSKVDLYSGNTLVFTSFVGTNPIVVGQYNNMRVKATGARHEVWINGVQQIDTLHDGNFFAGSVFIGSAQGAVSIKNMVLTYAEESVTAEPYFNEIDLLGTPPYGDLYGNPDSTGGNAINHPSTKGSYLYYVPAVKRMLEQLADAVFSRQVTLFDRGTSAISTTANTVVGIPDAEHTITIGSQRVAIVTLTFGYVNVGPIPGIIQLNVNGAAYDSWYLPRTDVTAGGFPGSEMRPFSISLPVELVAGTYTFAWSWIGGGNGQAEITSGGVGVGGSSRTSSITVIPA